LVAGRYDICTTLCIDDNALISVLTSVCLSSLTTSGVFHLHDVSVGPTLLRLGALSVLEKNAVHIGAGELEQLVGVVEDYHRDLTVTQNTQLIRLLHQTKLALRKCHLQHN